MKFITSKSMSYLASFFGFKKTRKRIACDTQPREEKIIRRPAHTDYRLVYDTSGELLLCFGACIKLDPEDNDFSSFFDECGRTGITIATIKGNGEIEFDEEDMELDPDDYVFAEHHPVHYYIPPIHSPDVSKVKTNAVLLEMV
jgi:hypothetical protein